MEESNDESCGGFKTETKNNDTHRCCSLQVGGVFLGLALLLNAIITYPLSVLLLIVKPDRMDEVYGEDTEARRILGCMYLAIAIVSTLALVVGGISTTTAKRNNNKKSIHRVLQLAVPLFLVQIIYKIATAFAVGLQDKNPVVIANLGVVGFQILTLTLNRKDVAMVFL